MGLPIKHYENYLVFEDGKIYSLITNKYLKKNVSKNGYETVELFNSSGSKRLLVHRLVAQTFIPNPNGLPQVNHIDENKCNNNVSNLEWCTAKYNMNYGKGAKKRHSKINYKKETYKINAIKNGKKTSRQVYQYDTQGNLIKEFNSINEASLLNGFKHNHISECCKGKRKTSNGYIWKYKNNKERRNDLSV